MMMDLIDREDLREALYIEAMVKDSEDQKWEGGCWIRYRMAERLIEEAPAVETTLYGYNIEHLAMIARVMQEKNVSPEKAIECFNDIKTMVQWIIEEQQQIIKKEVMNNVSSRYPF